MHKYLQSSISFFIIISLAACHKKAVPEATPPVQKTAGIKKIKPEPTVKVIAVVDDNAKKTLDGRNYYDFQDKRYWKNYKDGKYYLFNKSMYDNPDFKAPAQ
jgi:hypothetical protein